MSTLHNPFFFKQIYSSYHFVLPLQKTSSYLFASTNEYIEVLLLLWFDLLLTWKRRRDIWFLCAVYSELSSIDTNVRSWLVLTWNATCPSLHYVKGKKVWRLVRLRFMFLAIFHYREACLFNILQFRPWKGMATLSTRFYDCRTKALLKLFVTAFGVPNRFISGRLSLSLYWVVIKTCFVMLKIWRMTQPRPLRHPIAIVIQTSPERMAGCRCLLDTSSEWHFASPNKYMQL